MDRAFDAGHPGRRSPAADRGPALPERGSGGDSDDQLPTALDGNQGRPDRNPPHEVVRAVNRVDDPARFCSGRLGAELLAQDPVAREGIGDALTEKRLDAGVRLGDQRPVVLRGDRQLTDEVGERDRIGLVGQAVGEGEEGGGRVARPGSLGHAGSLPRRNGYDCPMPNRDLEQLAADYWDAYLAINPTQGTALGDHRYGDRLEPITTDEIAAALTRLRGLQSRVDAIDDHNLGDEEALTLSALRHVIAEDRVFLEADPHAYTVDAMNGPQVAFLNVPSLQPLRDAPDGEAMLARWRAMGPWVDAYIARLGGGLVDGLAPVAVGVERVTSELDALLARPVDDWPLLDPLRADHASWTDADWSRFGADLRAAVDDGLRPAFLRYRAFLADEALPRARDEAHAGIGNLPGGVERYVRLARAHTTTTLTPEELHAIGLAEIARIDAELDELGGRVLGTKGLEATLAALRADPALYFSTADEVQATAEASLAAANAAIPDWFGRLPVTPCEVVVMLPHEAEHSTIAYYREPAADGGRPGRYYINTSAPTTRPRYEAQALAFHESVPGHHLQIAIGQELSGLPDFRRHAEVTAFIEGWGLYSERLANEMGLYAGDLDRIGMISYDAWRASRLVVDTGMHALGWSRSRAIGFMTEHSALALNNITNEVDRYLGWPGQALAYKVGQLEIRRIRADAEAALRTRFDIRAFHDALLGHGALPLATLHEAVSRDLGLAA